MLLTKIPFFKEVILMSFSCPHCHFKNNEIQSGGSIADKGCKCALKVTSEKVSKWHICGPFMVGIYYH